MTLTSAEVGILLTALTIMIVGAHTAGHLLGKLRQPAVIAEILFGLLLGPSLLGLVAPGVQATLFPTSGAVASVLAGVSQLGLLLLMFVTGGEMRFRAVAGERRTIGWVAVIGLVLPFLFGLGITQVVDHRGLSGPNGNHATTTLVFGIAVAVTSIPVISRIMLDLGLLGGPFARIVLGVATIEDIVLYAALAVTLSLAQAGTADDFGLWALAGTQPTAVTVTYHVVVSLVFLGTFLLWGRRAVLAYLRSRLKPITGHSMVAVQLALLLCTVLVCCALSINPVFGALLAGMAVAPVRDGHGPSDEVAGSAGPQRGRSTGPASHADSWPAIRQFSLAFFIPIYFTGVGLKLDVVHHLDIVFCLWFFGLSCLVKMISVAAGARFAGQPRRQAMDLAVALNARGGPGIVLATVTLSAGVINENFFTAIVLLSVLTSQVAGVWLRYRRPHLRPEPAEPAADLAFAAPVNAETGPAGGDPGDQPGPGPRAGA